MTENDFETFGAEVKRLAVVMRLRASPPELVQITRAYFEAFKRYPLGIVTVGADRWIERGDRFPKAKQWIDVMPSPTAAALDELRQDESDDWLAAQRRGFEQSPCACVLCVAADVADKPLRFVPDVDRDGNDVRGRIGDKTITRGHWAHGGELAAYYRAKAEYFATLPAFRGPRRMPRATRALPLPRSKGRVITFRERLEEIFAPTKPKPREPGQEG